jgi:hypothetical protein
VTRDGLSESRGQALGLLDRGAFQELPKFTVDATSFDGRGLRHGAEQGRSSREALTGPIKDERCSSVSVLHDATLDVACLYACAFVEGFASRFPLQRLL